MLIGKREQDGELATSKGPGSALWLSTPSGSAGAGAARHWHDAPSWPAVAGGDG